MPSQETARSLRRYASGLVSDFLTEDACSTKQRIPEIDSAPYDLLTDCQAPLFVHTECK